MALRPPPTETAGPKAAGKGRGPPASRAALSDGLMAEPGVASAAPEARSLWSHAAPAGGGRLSRPRCTTGGVCSPFGADPFLLGFEVSHQTH